MNRDQEAPKWWKTATVEQFCVKISVMPRPQLAQLRAEVKGALALLQSQLASRGKTDILWWRRAVAAQGFMAEKQHLLSQALQKQHTVGIGKAAKQREREQREQERTTLLEEVRTLAEAGDVQHSLLKLVELLER